MSDLIHSSPLKTTDEVNLLESSPYMPQNIEAEQGLLGALLVNNEVYDKISHLIHSSHFFDPVHQRIYEVAVEKISRNSLASPVTLKTYFQNDPGLKELGGISYLAKLAASAISLFAAVDYAKLICELALRRNLINLGREISEKALSADIAESPEEQISTAESRLYNIAEKGSEATGFIPLLSASKEAIVIANKAYQQDGGISGISTGLIDLDKKLGGLHDSDLLIIAGRPSMGKTSLATNMAFNIANSYEKRVNEDGTEDLLKGGIVGFFSLEMSSAQLATRILSENSKVPSDKIRKGDLTENEFRGFIESAQDIEKCPLYIDDTAALPISALAGRARRLKRMYGLDILFIDYLQLIRPSSSRDSRVNEISEITQGLKSIAKELNIPVVALSQLSRQVEARDDKRPQLSDLRESGSIEQDSDVVMFIFREEYYKEREKPDEHDVENFLKWQEDMGRLHGRAELIIGKQRHGPIGTVDLSFQSKFTSFGNLAK